MKFIDENYEGLDPSIESNRSKHIFEYVVTPSDFILKMSMVWNVSEDENILWYTLKIGKQEVKLPSDVYIMLADVHSSAVDWVRVDELNGRELTTALYFTNLQADKYSIEDIEVVKIENSDAPSFVPKTKNLLPVLVGDDRMILCSERDSFVKTKNMNFACLY